jgi:hypothetical protein
VVAVTRAGGIEGAATVSTDYDDGAAAVARKVRVRTGATAWRTLAPGPPPGPGIRADDRGAGATPGDHATPARSSSQRAQYEDPTLCDQLESVAVRWGVAVPTRAAQAPLAAPDVGASTAPPNRLSRSP